jgi:4-hydroxy-2-oxoheptanedioate aldolase
VKTNRVKQLLKEGRPALGTFCYFPTTWVVEMVGLLGMDFVIIDLEHSARDMQLVEAMVVAAELNNVTSIIRVPSADEKLILQVLETGAQGIIVPLVDSAETAARAVAAAKYAPEGRRGVCRSTRAAQFSLSAPRFAEFARNANEQMLVIAMIEDRQGVDNVEEIVRTGIDGVVLGPADLSGSLGVMGDLEHPLVRQAIGRVTEAVDASDRVWLGNLVFNKDQVAEGLKRGHRFFCYGIDTQMLAASYRSAVADVHSVFDAFRRPEAGKRPA